MELSTVDHRVKALEQELAELRTQRASILQSIKETELQRRKDAFAAYRAPLASLMNQILCDDQLSFQCLICQDRYPRSHQDLFEQECMRMCEYRFPCNHSICLECAVRSLKYDVDFSEVTEVNQLCIKCPTCPTIYAMSITEMDDSEADATVLENGSHMHITCPGTPHDDDSSE